MGVDRKSSRATIDFSTFILSISTTAVTFMGVVENPSTRRTEVNLALAQQNIDILKMLSEKTSGNLTADESRLLDTLLYDLRLRFVEAKKQNPDA